MDFFEQELGKIFGEGNVIERPEFMARSCVGSLGADLRVKAEFVTCTYADHYEALQLTVLNRASGVVDSAMFRFKDVLGKKQIPDNPNFKEGIYPYIWTYQEKTEWYGYKPNAADYSAIREAAAKYLSAFRVQDRTKLVYICAPLRGDVEANIEFARQKAAEVFQQGFIPICPHLMFPPVADVNNPAQDERARKMGLQLVQLCSQVNVYGQEWTEGMWAEIHQAEKAGVPVYTDQKTLGRSSLQKSRNRNNDQER